MYRLSALTITSDSVRPSRSAFTFAARSRMRLLLRYLDARLVRRHWCGECNRATVVDHRRVVRFDHVIREEWRR